ncbi:helix-turn-helix transcriptional regulator [Oceanobacillus kimchii]|uniref:helix-turn-helix transcriptional regulator n=1 Tax=Oceanobacillus kimchii TaxID=746691 RepID=UPI00232C6365|nr:helix-turn-helix domain-containing protein [Oceanobacillus kimchii]
MNFWREVFKIHHKLFILRREKRMNQEKTAKFLGIDKQTYYRKESGRGEFTISEAKRLCKLFGCTLDDLFWSEDDAS